MAIFVKLLFSPYWETRGGFLFILSISFLYFSGSKYNLQWIDILYDYIWEL